MYSPSRTPDALLSCHGFLHAKFLLQSLHSLQTLSVVREHTLFIYLLEHKDIVLR